MVSSEREGKKRTKQETWSKKCKHHLDEAQNKSYEVERKLNRILWEYIEAFDKERGRPRLTMTKLWQLMQSRDTKKSNVDKDLDETLS